MPWPASVSKFLVVQSQWMSVATTLIHLIKLNAKLKDRENPSLILSIFFVFSLIMKIILFRFVPELRTYYSYYQINY